ncbi:DUF4926 domain-containing protein [Bacillus lacus]|uniref:DUF4926 domain-containing protein n=1 Tax=Metabacillus lacus TaxID=1983721 RepID=A0A7X2LYY5_9BACI|nr:DUF4926 domain-containing protein [Metabacillus lacus]
MDLYSRKIAGWAMDKTMTKEKGDIGTIIMVYDTPNKAYEVEFVDEEGEVKYQGVYLSNR